MSVMLPWHMYPSDEMWVRVGIEIMQNIKNCGYIFFLHKQKGVWSCIKAVGNHVGAVVLVDGMDKLHDVMGGVGEVGERVVFRDG